MAYYSGVGLDTIGAGGLNALAMAFFDPTPLGQNTCDFTDTNTNCIIPAAGSGGSKNLAWALNVFSVATPQLSANTSPTKNGKPLIYFSFGGQSQGGACWDYLFGSAAVAQKFGENAAKLVTTVYNTIGQSAYVGFDLDVEGMSTALPYISTFVAAFRANAAYDTFPLQLCSLSGLADPTNDDYFKIGIMQEVGPAQKGINFLNMMVANVDESCTGMQAYWLNSALSFIPAANKIFGMWGELLPSWILHEPGCTTGTNPLFPYMQQTGAGIGIWQWWSGDVSGVTSVLSQVRPN